MVIVFFVSGCASTKYAWKGYDSDLYNHYKDPGQQEKFMEQIKEIIDNAEPKKTVPPGIYAEYGYLLYESKQYAEAITYFQKEKGLWPESKVLMDKMISNTEKLIKKQ